MNTIDRLVRKLSPQGVPHKALAELGTFTRGGGPQKKDFIDAGTGCIHYGQIYTHYGISAEETNVFVAPEVASRSRTAAPGDVVIAVTGENDEDLGKAVAWLGDSPVAVSNHTLIFTSVLVPKFVSYFLQSTSFHQQKQRYITGTKVRSLPAKGLGSIRIPVPPLEVQQEIVRILDKFTQLEAELEAELEARQKQYAHYRQSVFSSIDAPSTPLRMLGEWRGGGTPAKSKPEYWTNGTVPWISPKDMGLTAIYETQDQITEEATLNSSARLLPKDSVALVVRSSILDRILPIAHVPIEAALNQDMRAVIAKEGVLPRYIFHALSNFSEDVLRRCRRTGGSVAALVTKQLMMFEIPLPDLVEQRRIVAILDSFDALVNGISSGLPAEIAARRKQYEYYRDKLLSFEELPA